MTPVQPAAAVTMFLQASVNSDGIPFPLRRTPNAETRAAFAEAEDMKKHPEKYKRYASFGDLLNEIEAEGDDA